MLKNILIFIQSFITIGVSLIVIPLCENLSEKYTWDESKVLGCAFLMLVIVSFCIQKIINYKDEYGKFDGFVKELSAKYKAIENNFKNLESDKERIDTYHRDVKIYMDLHTKSKAELEEKLSEFNKGKFEFIRASLQEIEEDVATEVLEINNIYYEKIYKDHRKKFGERLETLHKGLTKKLHRAEAYLENGQTCEKKDDYKQSSSF